PADRRRRHPGARRSRAGSPPDRPRRTRRDMMPGRVPSEHEVMSYVKTLSNWGRWGAEDELGTINLITPAKRAAAARLVRDGVAVTGARPIVTDITPDTTFQVMRFMVDSGEGRDTGSAERLLARRGAGEFIGMVFHGYTVTHIDTPAHFFWDGQIYNRPSCNLIPPPHPPT